MFDDFIFGIVRRLEDLELGNGEPLREVDLEKIFRGVPQLDKIFLLIFLCFGLSRAGMFDLVSFVCLIIGLLYGKVLRGGILRRIGLDY